MSHDQVLSTDNSSEVSGPLVFSCCKCKTIVGDSFSFLSSNIETNSITLSSSSNIQRTSELYTSYESLDEGSTYFCFMCGNCQQLLGRYYVTTSIDLDHIREKFTFNIENITSYELGKSQHGKLPDPIIISMPQIATSSSDSTNEILPNTIIQQSDVIIEVQDDIGKIQHVIVDLVQRVRSLENDLTSLKRSYQSSDLNINNIIKKSKQ